MASSEKENEKDSAFHGYTPYGNMALQFIVIVAAITSSFLAWHTSRPLSIVLARAAVIDIIREALGRWVLRPERVRLLGIVGGDEWVRPAFSGVIRIAYAADQALYLAGPATVAAFAALAFARLPRASLVGIAVAWVAWFASTAYLYPHLSGLAWATWQIGPANRCAHIMAAAMTGAMFLVWLSRGERPELHHRAALALGGAELLVAFAGPYAWGGAQGVWARWGLAGVIYIATDVWIGWHCWRARHCSGDN